MINRGQLSSDPPAWIRQFPNREARWGQCDYFFDPRERNYDWLVVENDFPYFFTEGQKKNEAKELLACSPENTLFITREPSSISTYGRRFLKQFRYVLTGQEEWALKHRGKIHSQPALRWYYGDSHEGNYDEIRFFDAIEKNIPLQKSQLISTMCSSKAQRHTMHWERLKFTEKLCEALPEIDRFGHGFKPIDDKAESLDAYKYHIAIENHQCEHWLTEKLSDAFLGHTLPFYYGAPNASDYFPVESFIPINIHDFEGSLKIIREAIANNEYEKRLDAISQARKIALYEQSTFPVISKIIEDLYDEKAPVESQITLFGRHALRKNPLAAIEIGFEKAHMRFCSILRKLRKSQ